jgi:hypothetical protein
MLKALAKSLERKALDPLNRESERIPRRFCLTAVLRGLGISERI